jgi:hypothetical protein
MGYEDKHGYYIPSRTVRFSDLAFDSENTSRVIGWFCECKCYNSLIDVICSRCTIILPVQLQPAAIKYKFGRTEFNLITSIKGKTLDDKQALYARFYADEKKLISSMDDLELENHLEEMASIAFEARARTTANQDELRERKGRKSSHERNLLQRSDSDFDSNSAISTVTERKKRMSRADKDFEAMKKLLGVEGASELLGKLDKTKYNPTGSTLSNRLDKSVELPTSELCRIDRHAECNTKYRIGEISHICKCSCHEPKFNPSELFSDAVTEGNLGNLLQSEGNLKLTLESSEQSPIELKPFNPDDLFK